MSGGILAALLAASLLAGCALLGTRSDPTTYFALTPTEPADEHPIGSWDTALGLGPIVIPGYLDRPQLVTRVAPNEVRLAVAARWAEPLREGIARALQQDLQAASGARQVARHPWPSPAGVDLAVAVDVLRFEPQGRGDVELQARWSVREAARGRVLVVRESHIAEAVQGEGTGAQVAALSRALGTLAREMALALRTARNPR